MFLPPVRDPKHESKLPAFNQNVKRNVDLTVTPKHGAFISLYSHIFQMITLDSIHHFVAAWPVLG